MTKNKPNKNREEGLMGLGGFLGGLGTLIDKLGELAEHGEELHKAGEFRSSDPEGKVRGVYGFSVKVGLGDQETKIEPFGNIHKDRQTGKTVVDEIREPLVDIFEEEDHVLVVAELPGIGEEDVQVELADDILTLSAGHGDKKYRKEVLLPQAFSADKMSRNCRNGVVEIKFTR